MPSEVIPCCHCGKPATVSRRRPVAEPTYCFACWKAHKEPDAIADARLTSTLAGLRLAAVATRTRVEGGTHAN